jgi:hypothetical protein
VWQVIAVNKIGNAGNDIILRNEVFEALRTVLFDPGQLKFVRAADRWLRVQFHGNYTIFVFHLFEILYVVRRLSVSLVCCWSISCGGALLSLSHETTSFLGMADELPE